MHTTSTEIHATGYTTPYITTSRLAVHIPISIRSYALERNDADGLRPYGACYLYCTTYLILSSLVAQTLS
jgi:hypothetical protein